MQMFYWKRKNKYTLINQTRFFMKNFFLLLIYFSTSIVSFSQKNNTKNQSIDEFWKDFRLALIQEDYKTLETLIDFPLYVRGLYDYDVTKSYTKANFKKLLKKYRTNNLEMLKNTVKIDKSEYEYFNEDKVLRFNNTFTDLKFHKVKKKWLLAFIYWPDGEEY